MDLNLDSPPAADSGDAKTAFRKPATDAANRKYRRRSPVGGSSPSDGSPMHEHNCSPKNSREDPGKVSEYQTRRRDDGRELERDSNRRYYGRSSDSYRHSDRQSSRSLHGYYKHDDCIKHDKHADEEDKNYQKLSSRSGRESRGSAYYDHIKSREYSRNLDKYSRDKYDGSGYRNKDKDRESSFPENQKYKDKDSSSQRVGSGRRHGHFEEMERERDRHALDRDVQDEKKDYRRNSGDYISERIFSYEESKGQRSDSISRRDEGKHRMKEGYKSELKELDDDNVSKEQRKKYDDKETSWGNRITRETSERSADKHYIKSENQESTAKRPKLFSSEKGIDGRKDVSKFTTTADGRESSSSKQVQEDEMTTEKTQANDAEAANDINAAKVAALKAAELVNRNLIGAGPVGCMTADQKKKLLWGNKKSTTAEEVGHRWDSTLFSDRERQEKFNKLMSLRLPWCLWPIVGCEGRSKGGTETRERRSEAEGTPNGFREAVHCWTAKKRWPYCWIRSLRILTFLRTVKTPGYSVVLLCKSHIYDSMLIFLLGVVDLRRKMVSHDNLTMCKARKFDCNMLGMNSSSIFLLLSSHLNSCAFVHLWSVLLALQQLCMCVFAS
ncbi:arginine/serine-rich coiled-coil protein 2 isoform X1 [Prunus persica]|uniref:arginine/serine-rich coiled-coil protein 2 isoform X1 n=1 Tax=Prunus persica TaxID=3760 RepID=UPI0009AB4DA7|nr:arginine/serine-rich coiled-coil protein 2 isoform X1 [Prunus persica]